MRVPKIFTMNAQNHAVICEVTAFCENKIRDFVMLQFFIGFPPNSLSSIVNNLGKIAAWEDFQGTFKQGTFKQGIFKQGKGNTQARMYVSPDSCVGNAFRSLYL